MIRKLKRTRDFDLSLYVRNDSFLRSPRDTQRNWLLNRVMREAVDDLRALDAVTQRFARGAERVMPVNMAEADLSDAEIMEDWQIPLMNAMAELVARSDAHLLEVGFGRGVSSEAIQRHGVASHTIIECNQAIARRFHAWRARYPDRQIELVPGMWQDAMPELGQFDAIFFHTYALSDEESADLLASSVTFAEHFFDAAAEHLRDGGVFTYLSNEIDSLGRGHQRALLSRFRSFSVRIVPLVIPVDVRDAWWADSMAVVAAVK